MYVHLEDNRKEYLNTLIFHQTYGAGFQGVDQRDRIHALEVAQVNSILQPVQQQDYKQL